MRFIRFNPLAAFLIVVCTTFVWFGTAQTTAHFRETDDIAVVVNPKNLVSDLSLAELRKMLLGERLFWNKGTPVILVLREAGSRERETILEKALQMDDRTFKHHWQEKVFRGETTNEPLALPSNGLASEYVGSTPGGLMFVSGKNLRPDLKVLKIDGKFPGDPGYPFR